MFYDILTAIKNSETNNQCLITNVDLFVSSWNKELWAYMEFIPEPIWEEDKVKTFTVDFGDGGIVVTDAKSAIDLINCDDAFEATITVEKKYTQKELDEMKEYQ